MRINAKRTTLARGKVALAAAAITLLAAGIPAARAQSLTNYGTYIITNVHSGLALGDPAAAATTGPDAEQLAVTNATSQQWVVTNQGQTGDATGSAGYFELENVSSGQFLDVVGASTASGALVDINSNTGAANQNWRAVSLGGGHYEVINQSSGLALGVVGGSASSGAEIDQATYTGSASQQWVFTPLAPATGGILGYGCIGRCVPCGENCYAAQGTSGTTTFQLTALASGNWNSAGVHTIGNYQIGHSNQLPDQQAAYFEFDLTPVQGRSVTDALILIPGSTDYDIGTTYKPMECPAAPAPCFKAGIAAEGSYPVEDVVSPSSNNSVEIYLSGGDTNRDKELGYGWVADGLHLGVEFGAFTTVVFNENYYPARVQNEVDAGGDWVFWARDDFDAGQSNLSGGGACPACPGGVENYIWGQTGYNTGIILLLTVRGGEASIPVVPNGIYEVKNLNSGAALEVASAKNGAPLDQSAYTGDSKQLWKVARLVDGNYTITNVGTGQQLDASNYASPWEAARTALADKTANQEWTITPTTDGNYTIKSVRSGLLLDVASAMTLKGAGIVLGTAQNGYAHQQWSFKPSNANLQASLTGHEAARGTVQ
jgi:hypothetical protein